MRKIFLIFLINTIFIFAIESQNDKIALIDIKEDSFFNGEFVNGLAGGTISGASSNLNEVFLFFLLFNFIYELFHISDKPFEFEDKAEKFKQKEHYLKITKIIDEYLSQNLENYLPIQEIKKVNSMDLDYNLRRIRVRNFFDRNNLKYAIFIAVKSDGLLWIMINKELKNILYLKTSEDDFNGIQKFIDEFKKL